MPRSRWKVRNANDPGIDTANTAASPAPLSTAATHGARPRMPRSTSAGHTFSSAPNAARPPATRGCRPARTRAATATAVTITS